MYTFTGKNTEIELENISAIPFPIGGDEKNINRNEYRSY